MHRIRGPDLEETGRAADAHHRGPLQLGLQLLHLDVDQGSRRGVSQLDPELGASDAVDLDADAIAQTDVEQTLDRDRVHQLFAVGQHDAALPFRFDHELAVLDIDGELLDRVGRAIDRQLGR